MATNSDNAKTVVIDHFGGFFTFESPTSKISL